MNRNVINSNNQNIKMSKMKHYIILCLILFAFWFVLSGHTEPRLLILGILTVLVTAWVTGPLLKLPSTDGQGFFYAFDLPLFKYFAYWAWLLVEIVKSNIDIFKILINPKMPINPQIIKFKKTMKNPIAHVTLGNSITLTPGTVTMDIEGEDTYIIHALTDEFAAALVPLTGEGEMQMKVGKLFGEDWGQRSADKDAE